MSLGGLGAQIPSHRADPIADVGGRPVVAETGIGTTSRAPPNSYSRYQFKMQSAVTALENCLPEFIQGDHPSDIAVQVVHRHSMMVGVL